MPAPGTTRSRATPARADRRDSLLDVAAQMVADGRFEQLSMESVAAVAGVSRALVYKHFINRHDLLGALYERESALLHERLSTDVRAARGLTEMLGALARGACAAQASRGATFAALSAGGSRSTGQRDLQRLRDAQTLRHFARQAMSEFDLDEADARAGLAIALGAIPTVLAQWRRRPTPEYASHLEHAYVAMAIGGIKELSHARTAADSW